MSLGVLLMLTMLLSPIPIAVWTAIDAYERKMLALVWAPVVLILLPLALPIYLAARSLKPGETREGGRGWNVLKNFALLWTLLVVLIEIVFLEMAFSSAVFTAKERVGQVIFNVLIGVAVWIGPMIVAMIVGAFIRKSGMIECGPTGGLMTRELAL